MNLLIAAMTGWGKSHTAQHKIEMNLPNVDYAVILDDSDEYRGLVKAGMATWYVAGPKQVRLSVDEWKRFIEANPKTVIPRHELNRYEWQTIVGRICAAVIRLSRTREGNVRTLVAIDEANKLAPEGKKYPDSIQSIATAGRGDNVSAIWITQRLQMLDKDVVGECNAIYAGGFRDRNDLDALPGDYPKEVHDPSAQNLPTLPPELQAENPNGSPNIPLRKWVNEETGALVGSEWIYSDDFGELRREDRRNVDMKTTHYGKPGYTLKL